MESEPARELGLGANDGASARVWDSSSPLSAARVEEVRLSASSNPPRRELTGSNPVPELIPLVRAPGR
jgi:hypothetical protein